jgi:hypothetical protein
MIYLVLHFYFFKEADQIIEKRVILLLSLPEVGFMLNHNRIHKRLIVLKISPLIVFDKTLIVLLNLIVLKLLANLLELLLYV